MSSHGSICRIGGALAAALAFASPTTAWRLDTQCTGEGESWADVFVIGMVDVSGSERLQMQDVDGTKWILAPC